MEHLDLRAHAKINLALDVISKREDGYHNIKTIMQSLWLHDEIFIRRIDKFSYKFVCDSYNVPTDDRNIINTAAAKMIKDYGIKEGMFIKLTKNIPIAAGLGGGSADCASILFGLRKLFSLSISNSELMQIGKSLGADVPFCIMRGTALAEGVGDVLTPLTNAGHRNTFIVLVRPPVYVSTRDVFADFNFSEVKDKPDFDGIIHALAHGDAVMLAGKLYNALETVTAKKYPVIAELKASLLAHGALGAVMSGSGPSVFGVFSNKKLAESAMRKIRAENPDVKEIFLTTMFNPGRN